MIIRVCTFTDKGYEIAKKLQNACKEDLFEIKDRNVDAGLWTGESFEIHSPIVFISAMGIAVRMIAPFIKDKLSDSPVLVIDERGQYVIPVLSGHVGGANKLAREFSKALSANLVITTATDINGLFSVDEFAVNNGLEIVNKDGIKAVSSKLLKGEEIVIAIEDGIEADIDSFPRNVKVVRPENGGFADVVVTLEASKLKASLVLRAKKYILGIGCKKDTSYEQIALKMEKYSEYDIAAMASIDIKARERGLLMYSQIRKIPFLTYNQETLSSLEGDFSESEFVKSVTGVSNVCERAAMAAAGEGGKLIVKKDAGDKITVAIAQRKVVLHG